MYFTKEEIDFLAKNIVDDNVTLPDHVLADKAAMALLQPAMDAYKDSIGNNPTENVDLLNEPKENATVMDRVKAHLKNKPE